MINVSPKVRFTENIKIQSEPRFRRYSMNTLNTYRRHRHPCKWHSVAVRWCTMNSYTSFTLLYVT